MSCIAGSLSFGSSRPGRETVGRMLAAMRERAPDGDSFFERQEISAGMALLRTGASGPEAQPALTLDGEVWLVADARIDDRTELLRALRHKGGEVADTAPHAELILRAYAAWEENALDHLIGDFAFALWDGRRRKLVCARDHFGTRPFYYAKTEEALVFASDIRALLASGAVSGDIDDAAAIDFLLFGMCPQPEHTIYRQIRCLAPATRMEVSSGEMRFARYWEAPRRGRTILIRPDEYVQQFSQLFTQAVRDRLPEAPVAVQLSGGMDSTSIAAVAAGGLNTSAHRVAAYHLSCRQVLARDPEGELARTVADHLGIDLVWQDVSDAPLLACDRSSLDTAFPVGYPHLAVHRETIARITATGTHVLLSGHNGDAAMMPAATYYSDLLLSGRLGQFVTECAHHLRHARSLRGLGLRRLLHPQKEQFSWKPALPDWIDTPGDSLRQRWEQWWTEHENAIDAERQFRLGWLHRQCEVNEALRFPVVFRYPFQDVRLLKFLARVPNFMLVNKSILRTAMAGLLPDPVRLRPKTALLGDPVRNIVTNGKLTPRSLLAGSDFPPLISTAKFLAAWEKYIEGAGAESTWSSWWMMQPIALANWLSQRQEFVNE